jgi:hypothetical protein
MSLLQRHVSDSSEAAYAREDEGRVRLVLQLKVSLCLLTCVPAQYVNTLMMMMMMMMMIMMMMMMMII